jgi:hypothetical protein
MKYIIILSFKNLKWEKLAGFVENLDGELNEC